MSKTDRIAVFLGHPAHYHMFKHMTAELERQGIEVDYLVKRKDMLEDLVRRSGHSYHIVRRQERNAKGKWGLAWSLIRMELNVTAYLLRRRPRLLIGTYAPVISHLTGVPMIICCEDDTSVIPRFARTSYPYAKAILTGCAKELADLAIVLRGKLDFGDEDVPVSGTGGVFKIGPAVTQPFDEILRAHGMHYVEPATTPDMGALMLAVKYGQQK